MSGRIITHNKLLSTIGLKEQVIIKIMKTSKEAESCMQSGLCSLVFRSKWQQLRSLAVSKLKSSTQDIQDFMLKSGCLLGG